MNAVIALGLLLTLGCAPAAGADTLPMEMRVTVQGDHVIVDASVPLPVTRQQAWAVMTDYDHMADFLPSQQETRILSRNGNILTTYQRGVARYGVISYAFELTREVVLTPFERIDSRLLHGNMKLLDTTAQLREVEGQLWLNYHSDSIPHLWLPSFVLRSFVEHETREQLKALRHEMLRRVPAQ